MYGQSNMHENDTRSRHFIFETGIGTGLFRWDNGRQQLGGMPARTKAKCYRYCNESFTVFLNSYG